MTRVKAIIIDDEENAASRLKDLADKHLDKLVTVLGCYHTVEAGIQAIQLLQPQLVFLDVQIHDKTGFDLLNEVPVKNFQVIFVTAFEKYAVQAFRFSAIDYLLKPVDVDDLKEAVKKAANKKPGDNVAGHLRALLENVEQLKQYTPPKKIVVPTISGFELIPVIDILRCQSNVNYTTIFMQGGQKLVVAKTLKEFEEMLNEYNFLRVHASHLVNLAYVKSYQKGKGGAVILTDGAEIEVSKARKEDLIRYFNQL